MASTGPPTDASSCSRKRPGPRNPESSSSIEICRGSTDPRRRRLRYFAAALTLPIRLQWQRRAYPPSDVPADGEAIRRIGRGDDIRLGARRLETSRRRHIIGTVDGARFAALHFRASHIPAGHATSLVAVMRVTGAAPGERQKFTRKSRENRPTNSRRLGMQRRAEELPAASVPRGCNSRNKGTRAG